jgi:hypothetical protein
MEISPSFEMKALITSNYNEGRFVGFAWLSGESAAMTFSKSAFWTALAGSL